MYKKLIRPIRTILISFLFRLLQLPESLKGLAIYEDLTEFEDSEESYGLSNGMKYRHSVALARVYLDDDYKNYLYYLLMKVQRDNIKTIEPYKRDAQTATALWILKHIHDMKRSQNEITKKKGPQFRKMMKDVLKRKHKQKEEINITN